MSEHRSNKSKIFGIGLSKTGTTSLGKALECLGLDVMHFPIHMLDYNAPRYIKAACKPFNSYASAFNKELLGFRESLYSIGKNDVNLDYLSECDAAMDLPVSRYYKELDRRFPDSKFILTIRDEDEWITSAKKHFHPSRSTQNRDYRNRMRLDIYGSILFDEQKFRQAFRRHHKQVKQYFSQRPDSLLIMDIASGDGWPKLCEYLNLKIPENLPFPHSNKAPGEKLVS